MAGGGKDFDDAFRWSIRKSGSDGYNQHIRNLDPVDSVASIVIKSRAAASHPFVLDKVRKAEAIFIAGGDQMELRLLLEGHAPGSHHSRRGEARRPHRRNQCRPRHPRAIFVLHRNGHHHHITASAVQPLRSHLILESSYLKLPNLEGVITGSHFSQRDRFGRLLAFLACIAQHTLFDNGVAKGVGIDERKAVLLEPDGSATIAGEGVPYFASANKKTGVCAAGKLLTFEDLSVYRIPAGGKFNFRSWTGQGGSDFVTFLSLPH